MPISSAAAQQFLDIETIREGVVVLKNGGLRVVLMCSSLNFALKSTEEQDAITFQYQNFLNSLDFSLQTVVHSRRFNIEPYLETLRQRQKEEANELMKIQISEYLEFIRTFSETTNIMSKTFYTVVPFNPGVSIKKGFLKDLISSAGFGKNKNDSVEDSFTENKTQLWQRVDSVTEGLQRMSVRSVPLNTEELIELFYGLYNPTEFEKITMPAQQAKA